jgi:peptide-methionine (S)-S-oxide reductase
LNSAGSWLREKIGDALDGFFSKPYLLWFVAEDPVRNGRLPGNIAEATGTIIDAARLQRVESLQEQLDYALRLVCWSWIARECGVQIALIDVLIDAGASRDGRDNSEAAIYNGNFAAAEHLLERGALLSLSAALCLGRWAEMEQLAANASLAEKQDAFVLAARHGQSEALRRMLVVGLDPTTVSAQNQSHASALHHAVWSGSLEAVKVLVEAGADLTRRDKLHSATPLGWAEYGAAEQKDKLNQKPYAEIAAYLRQRGG